MYCPVSPFAREEATADVEQRSPQLTASQTVLRMNAFLYWGAQDAQRFPQRAKHIKQKARRCQPTSLKLGETLRPIFGG